MEKPIKIKTLNDILADMGEPMSAHFSTSKKATQPNLTNTQDVQDDLDDLSYQKPDNLPQSTKKPTKKRQPSTKPAEKSSVQTLLDDDNQTVLDDDLLKLLSKVEIEKLQIPDKATRYMRWLAFYYLGRREHSQKELRAKLLAKDCDSEAVEALLIEFADKGYQSDQRMTSALIKDGIGKKYGKRRILQTLQKHGLNTVSSVKDIERWTREHEEFFADLTTDDDHDEDLAVDWLAQAVFARCKKYGNHIPTDPKEKARQLRFLQYRGFEMSVCFDALKMTVDDFTPPL